ncbi:MAG: hypothetical protein EBT93_07405 [Alphaproteobacteria bacterium]|nr:hypothetical protein [Alphaproteobacteria bacterium]
MKLGKLKNVIGAMAPTLGQAMGGPLGGMAGKVIAGALGCDPNPAAIDKAIQEATPEQLAQIRAADLDFKQKIAELEVDLFALETADKQDARSHFAGDWVPKVFAILALAGCFSYIFLVTLQPPDANSDTIVSLVLGNMFGVLGAIVSFYFGASHSGKKDE